MHRYDPRLPLVVGGYALARPFQGRWVREAGDAELARVNALNPGVIRDKYQHARGGEVEYALLCVKASGAGAEWVILLNLATNIEYEGVRCPR